MSDPLPPGRSADPPTGDAPVPAGAPREAPAGASSPQDLGAPRYAVPAYAAPEPGAPPEPGATARYAPPPGYAVPVLSPEAGTQDGALPPYARIAAPVPPSASGYPGAPGSSVPPFGPPAPRAGVFPASSGIDHRPKVLAIVALVLAGAGILLTLVASTLGSAGWLAALLLFAGFVLSLVALISRNQGGKGFGVGALVLSILGGVMTVVIAIAWVFGSFGPSYVSGGSDPDGGDGFSDGYAAPGLAAPGTDGQPDPGDEFAPPVQPTVAEAAFGRDFDDSWWFVVIVDNPNADYIFDAYLEVHAVTDDGSTVPSSTAFATLLSGRTAVVGYFFDVGDAEITGLRADLPEASEATLSPGDETGSFAVDGLTRSNDGTGAAVTGTARANFADDQQYVAITVLARSADGSIVAASTAYADALPGDGTPVPFEAWFAELPPDATFEASAHR